MRIVRKNGKSCNRSRSAIAQLFEPSAGIDDISGIFGSSPCWARNVRGFDQSSISDMPASRRSRVMTTGAIASSISLMSSVPSRMSKSGLVSGRFGRNMPRKRSANSSPLLNSTERWSSEIALVVRVLVLIRTISTDAPHRRQVSQRLELCRKLPRVESRPYMSVNSATKIFTDRLCFRRIACHSISISPQ